MRKRSIRSLLYKLCVTGSSLMQKFNYAVLSFFNLENHMVLLSGFKQSNPYVFIVIRADFNREQAYS